MAPAGRSLILLGVAVIYTFNIHAVKACGVLSDVNGCSTPFGLDVPYKTQFTPACLHHDVCYRCGMMYSWTQIDCDKSFKKKMYVICDKLSTLSSLSVSDNQQPQALFSTLSKIKEIYRKIREGWKKATANGTPADEVKRLWEASKNIAKIVIKLVFTSDKLKKCKYAADVYYESVAAFGIYRYRSQSKPHCSEPCAKKLGFPF